MNNLTPPDHRPLAAGVMGWPIAHSKSPRIFAHWFTETGIKGTYGRLAVEPADFAPRFRSLATSRLRGVNVTIPHKVTALELADEVSAAAHAIGAANTVSVDLGGRIFADNTDGYGFITNLQSAAPDWCAATGPALVLGAGGAARAVIYALLEAGAPAIRLVNRSHHKAEALRDHFGSRVNTVDWAARHTATAGAATIVNATSLGMSGKPPLGLTLEDAPACALVTDIVYMPLETPLLAAARARGLTTVDGLGMLLHQARPGFHAWFGVNPAVTPALRQAVLEGRA